MRSTKTRAIPTRRSAESWTANAETSKLRRRTMPTKGQIIGECERLKGQLEDIRDTLGGSKPWPIVIKNVLETMQRIETLVSNLEVK
jgi:hypothetical protein